MSAVTITSLIPFNLLPGPTLLSPTFNCLLLAQLYLFLSLSLQLFFHYLFYWHYVLIFSYSTASNPLSLYPLSTFFVEMPGKCWAFNTASHFSCADEIFRYITPAKTTNLLCYLYIYPSLHRSIFYPFICSSSLAFYSSAHHHLLFYKLWKINFVEETKWII